MDLKDLITIWFSKPLAVLLLAYVIILIFALLGKVPALVRQARCKHAAVGDDAICSACGKEFGALHKWREEGRE